MQLWDAILNIYNVVDCGELKTGNSLFYTLQYCATLCCFMMQKFSNTFFKFIITDKCEEVKWREQKIYFMTNIEQILN